LLRAAWLQPSSSDTRIALSEGPQIAEASLFDHVQLNSYRLLKRNKPNDVESTNQLVTRIAPESFLIAG
jgi:hypothetical protein